jgi:hypothetical protein
MSELVSSIIRLDSGDGSGDLHFQSLHSLYGLKTTASRELNSGRPADLDKCLLRLKFRIIRDSGEKSALSCSRA